MSHNVETMAWTNEVPWHGLGVRVPNDLSPAQILKSAGLDWTVEKIPAYAEVDGEHVDVNRSALVRNRNGKKDVLDVVGNDWNPTQNHEAFEFFHDWVTEGGMNMETAGSLKGGQIVWALAKINDSFFDVFKGDKTEGYLLFTNPHRFGQSIDIRFTPIRVVCNNTLTLSLSSNSSNRVKVSHRKVFDADEVKETMGLVTTKMNKYKDVAKFLGSKKYKTQSITEYMTKIFPLLTTDPDRKDEISRPATTALALVENQPGANFARGSWWQAFNAVTYMADHVIGRSNNTRLMSAWYGQNKTRKQKALDLAVEYANAA